MKRLWPYLGLSLSSFCAYQCRAAMLFIVPLLCLQGKKTAAFVLTPLLTFLVFRYAVVEDLGLCSGGGVQSSGYVAGLIQPGDQDKMPDDVKSLYEKVLAFKPPFVDTIHISASDRKYYTIWANEAPYEEVLWKATGAKGPDNKEANRLLFAFTLDTIWAHPLDYLKLVGRSFLAGLRNWPDPVVFVLLLAGYFLSWVASVVYCPFYPTLQEKANSRRFFEFFVGAVVYGVTGLAALCFVTFPADRYLHMLYLFVPSALCLGIYTNVQVLRG